MLDLFLFFIMAVATIQCLNTEDKNLKKKKIAVYGSDTPVILKQDQGHQTGYKSVEPMQSYNHAKFENKQTNKQKKLA